jgi:predicted nucleic acid-binding protein
MDFVDTSILLYAYDSTAGTRHDRARDLVGRLGRERTGALSVQVLQEFYVNAVAKIKQPLSPEAARQRLRALSRWSTHSPLAPDVLAATAISEDLQISFRDAMIVRSASELGCTCLWTQDLDHGQMMLGVRVSNPFVPD